jgi:TPR repeat protein
VAGKHLEGVPGPYDVRQAMQWASRAADYGSIEGQALYGKLMFDGDGISRQPVDGLTYLFITLARTTPDDRKTREMAAAATAKSKTDEVALAQQRAQEWLKKNGATQAAPGALTQ